MRKSKKISDASTRVLETLKVLSNGSVSIQDIIKHFEKIDPNNRVYTNEAILKYINTLKVFGFRIIKEKDKYIMLNSVTQFDLNKDDLKALCLIEKYASIFPEKQAQSELGKFVQDVEKRFNDNTTILAGSIKKTYIKDLKFDYNRFLSQAKNYEKYCQDELRLKITYKEKNQDVVSVVVEPCEIKYIGNSVFFSVYNPLLAVIKNINFTSIIKVEQLPSKSNHANMFSSVTFLLKNRLAKVYKLHEGETMLQQKDDGSLVILNKKEDRTQLLKRIMRYGENCEILSPKSVRQDMNNLIKSTLQNYVMNP